MGLDSDISSLTGIWELRINILAGVQKINISRSSSITINKLKA